ncbi:hypothetical protein SCHPADRAFT_987179 [Schizopora paradoxa]|uniref:Uncharacterized protein n=1 Tax=Schizopora paradoxa TaxID=27342 RepID=A0A0H2R3T3_9AGAM|nr:hypothetical protein SCHPADRAFT_987179 [Schizopora paradoxa]
MGVDPEAARKTTRAANRSYFLDISCAWAANFSAARKLPFNDTFSVFRARGSGWLRTTTTSHSGPVSQPSNRHMMSDLFESKEYHESTYLVLFDKSLDSKLIHIIKQICQCKLCRAARNEHVKSGFKTKLGAASISSLIPDILQEIFEHGCSTSASFIPNRTVAPALAYSQVCRSWRSLALAQSTLWSSFSWGYERSDNYKELEDFTLVPLWDLYLSRSGQALLEVTLYFYMSDTPELREHLLDSIFNEQHRLKGLYMKCGVLVNVLPETKAYLLSAAPNLRFLNIDVAILDETLRPAPLKKAITVDLSSLTSLQELAACGNVLLKGKLPVNVLDSLRTLSYWPSDIVTSHNSASQASLFHAPDIHSSGFSGESVGALPLSSRYLTLCHLRELRLRLSARDAEIADSILADSDISALEELTIEFFGEPIDVYRRRRWTHGKVLKTLKVLMLIWSQEGTQDPLFDEDLRRFLQCTPALKALNIVADWISPQTLSLLTLRSFEDTSSASDENVCPSLEDIALSRNVKVIRNISTQHVVDLISSRWRPHDSAGLTEINLCLDLSDYDRDGQVDLCTVEPLCSFIKQGLKVYFALDIMAIM